jgi:hydroxypyruvate isomerase
LAARSLLLDDGLCHRTLTDEDGARELLRTAEQSLVVAERLGCPRLNLHGTGLDAIGLPVRPVHRVTGAMWITSSRTLSRVAELGERAGVTFCLENLNTAVDTPACRSPVPPTPSPWSRPLTAPGCG